MQRMIEESQDRAFPFDQEKLIEGIIYVQLTEMEESSARSYTKICS